MLKMNLETPGGFDASGLTSKRASLTSALGALISMARKTSMGEMSL